MDIRCEFSTLSRIAKVPINLLLYTPPARSHCDVRGRGGLDRSGYRVMRWHTKTWFHATNMNRVLGGSLNIPAGIILTCAMQRNPGHRRDALGYGLWFRSAAFLVSRRYAPCIRGMLLGPRRIWPQATKAHSARSALRPRLS